MQQPIITRKDAINRGLNKYFSGIPCKYGHIAWHYVTTCACLECLKIYRARASVQFIRKQIDFERGFIPCPGMIHRSNAGLIQDFVNLVNQFENDPEGVGRKLVKLRAYIQALEFE